MPGDRCAIGEGWNSSCADPPLFSGLAAAFQDQVLQQSLDAVIMNTGWDECRTVDCIKRLFNLRTLPADESVREMLIREQDLCSIPGSGARGPVSEQNHCGLRIWDRGSDPTPGIARPSPDRVCRGIGEVEIRTEKACGVLRIHGMGAIDRNLGSGFRFHTLRWFTWLVPGC
jgi:hypothetical protein